MSECYPTDIRTQSIGITRSFVMICYAACVKFFPDMKSAIGLSNCLFLYGSIAFLNCIWGVIFIPDNRGKSLVKVEEMYEKNNKNEINEKST